MVNGGYDVAQICFNGHVINPGALRNPDFNKNFCNICGAKTMMTCLNCNASIQGWYHGGIALEYYPPSFCHHCGEPYPWTIAKLTSAKELVEELEGLTKDEKIKLIDNIEEIVKETPNTEIASIRIKNYLAKARGIAKNLLTDVISKIATEAAKGYLGF